MHSNKSAGNSPVYYRVTPTSISSVPLKSVAERAVSPVFLKESCVIDEWYLNDICDGCREKVASLFPGQSPLFIAGNAEEIDFPGRFDLIASASAFQWMKEPIQFLHKLAGMLSPNGTLLFNTFAPGNLAEIRQLTSKGLTYPSGELLTEWLEENFHLIHLREEEIILTFDTPLDVLRH